MRRWLLLAGLLSVVLALPSGAQQLGTYEQITVSTSSVGLATATTNPTGRPQMNYCEAVLETAAVRFRDDGTAPTSTVGTPLNPGDVLPMNGNQYARNVRFIRSGAVDATLNVRCYP